MRRFSLCTSRSGGKHCSTEALGFGVQVTSFGPNAFRRAAILGAHILYLCQIGKQNFPTPSVKSTCYAFRFALLGRGGKIRSRQALSFGVQIISYGLSTSMCTYTLRAHLMPSFSDLFQNVGLTSFLFAVQHCTAYRMPTSPSRLAGQRLSVSGLTKATNNLSLPAVKSTCSASSLCTTQSGRKYCDTQALGFGVQITSYGPNTFMCNYTETVHTFI